MSQIAELVGNYRALRDELAQKRKEFNDFEKEQKEKMFEVETEMLNLANELGVESFKTENGTAYKTLKTYARLGAGPEAKAAREKYAMETGDFGLFTSHVNKTHAKELLDDGKNLAEIGVDWIQEWSMGFRKPA